MIEPLVSIDLSMAGENVEMTLRDYGNVIARRKWIVVFAVILTTVTVIALTALQTPIYSASAEVLVQPRGQDGFFDNQTNYVDPERAIDTEIQVIEGQEVNERVQENLGLSTPPPGASASAVGSTDVISIVVNDTNASNAATLADAYAVAYVDVRREQSVNELLKASTEVQIADPTASRCRSTCSAETIFAHRAGQPIVELQHHARPAPCRRRIAYRGSRDHQVGGRPDVADRTDTDAHDRARGGRRSTHRARSRVPDRLSGRQGPLGRRPRFAGRSARTRRRSGRRTS